ncbi:MAG: DNA repair protein RadA [Clostridia bacterium]|nr:DNA repair protein RadA [Clostridia bacterium]MBT7122705.1 DNA repair protein RadA [Clostridia bacterium]
MAKDKTAFVCSDCGYNSVKWMGQCPSCKQWNTMQEMTVAAPTKARAARAASKAVYLKDVSQQASARWSTGFGELDRVLGGGVVEGSVVLAGGEPGIGKSTLFLQVASALVKAGKKVLYISGEESLRQIRMRAKRLSSSGEIMLLAETEISNCIAAMNEHAPDFVVVDSIQTMYSEDINPAPGSVSQIKQCASILTMQAKTSGAAVFIIGHVTKEGAIAGPRILEHMVDTVLYFEGERQGTFRILRAEKNRFGSTNEIGVFDMRDSGMKEVENPSGVLLSERNASASGSCVYPSLEGTRPVLLEIQALVSTTSFNMPRRMASGLEYNRMALIIAVLEKRMGLKLFNQDVYINVAGGIKLNQPAADLAMAASIVSSFRDSAVSDVAAMGEVGLTGEVRAVGQIEKRLNECSKMGFNKAVIPKANLKGTKIPEGMQVHGVRNVFDALEILI